MVFRSWLGPAFLFWLAQGDGAIRNVVMRFI